MIIYTIKEGGRSCIIYTSNFSINTISNSKTQKQRKNEGEIGESIGLPLE